MAYHLVTSARDRGYTDDVKSDEGNITVMTTTERPVRRRVRVSPPVADHPAVNFRIPEELWAEFGDACAALGWNRSEALRHFVSWFTWTPGASKPIRPRYEQLHEPMQQEPQNGAA